jgi:hypothetical protein
VPLGENYRHNVFSPQCPDNTERRGHRGLMRSS